MRRSRSPSLAEVKLWRSAMRDVKPLHPLEPLPPEAEPPVVPLPPPVSPAAPPPPKILRRPNGVDGNTLRALKKGERAIEATIDLHGMTLDRAHHALRRFIEVQSRAERRCLLVITGKGGADRPGLLKREVPFWLSEWRPPVLLVTEAAPQHGGSGALYVLLQRQR